MQNEKATILIVDDEENNVELMAAMFSHQYNIKVAYNGKQALKALDKFDDIDLVLLDIVMPKVDGFEVAQKIMENEKTKNIPFIFLTAYVEKSVIEKCMELGATDYITKPIDSSVLKKVASHIK